MSVPPLINSIPHPNQTGCLRAIVNADQAMAKFYGSVVLPPESVITDCNHYTFPPPNDTANDFTFQQTLDWIVANLPGVAAGSYISAFTPLTAAALADPNSGVLPSVPQARLSDTLFTDPGDYLPSATPEIDPINPVVDFTRSGPRTKLINAIVAEMQSRFDTYGVGLLFTDNWVFNLSGDSIDVNPAGFTWDQVLTYMEALTAALHGIGVKHCPNFHYRVGTPDISTTEATRLGSACDLITFERAADVVTFGSNAQVQRAQNTLTNTLGEDFTGVPAIGEGATGISRMLAQYSAITTAGLPVIMIPQSYEAATGIDAFLAQARMLAGLAMIVQNAMVAVSFFFGRQDWFTWPTLFGTPTGPIVQNGTTVSRAFGAQTIVVDFATQQTSVTATPPAPPPVDTIPSSDGVSVKTAVFFTQQTYDQISPSLNGTARLFVTFNDIDVPAGLTAGTPYTWVGTDSALSVAGTGLAATADLADEDFATAGVIQLSLVTRDGEPLAMGTMPTDLVTPGGYRLWSYAGSPTADRAIESISVMWSGLRIITAIDG